MTAPSPSARALAVLELAQAGHFEEIRDRFAEPLRPMVATEALRAGWEGALTRLGPLTAVGEPLTEPAPHGAAVVKVPLECERGAEA